MAEIAPPPPNIVAPAVEQPQPAVQPTVAETNPPAAAETQTPPAGPERQASREVPRERQVREMGRVARATLNRKINEMREKPPAAPNEGQAALKTLDLLANLTQEQIDGEVELSGTPHSVTVATESGPVTGTLVAIASVDGDTFYCTVHTPSGERLTNKAVSRDAVFTSHLRAEQASIGSLLPVEQQKVLDMYLRAQETGGTLAESDGEINQSIEAAAGAAGFPTRASLEKFLQRAIPDGDAPQGENGAAPDPKQLAEYQAKVQANAARREAALALCDGQNVPDAATVNKVLGEAGFRPDEMKQRLAEAQQDLRTYSEIAKLKPGEMYQGKPMTAEDIERAKSGIDLAQAEIGAYTEASKGDGPIEQYMKMVDDGTITREQATAVMGAIETGDVNAMVDCMNPDLQDDINDDAQKIGIKRKKRELMAGRLRKMGGLAGAAAAIMAMVAFLGSKQNKG